MLFIFLGPSGTPKINGQKPMENTAKPEYASNAYGSSFWEAENRFHNIESKWRLKKTM